MSAKQTHWRWISMLYTSISSFGTSWRMLHGEQEMLRLPRHLILIEVHIILLLYCPLDFNLWCLLCACTIVWVVFIIYLSRKMCNHNRNVKINVIKPREKALIQNLCISVHWYKCFYFWREFIATNRVSHWDKGFGSSALFSLPTWVFM